MNTKMGWTKGGVELKEHTVWVQLSYILIVNLTAANISGYSQENYTEKHIPIITEQSYCN